MNKLKLFLLFLFPLYCAYSQPIDVICVEHIGNIDKPFRQVKVQYHNTSTTKFDNNQIIIIDTIVFSEIYKYLSSEFVGNISEPDFEYGTFCITSYQKNKPVSKIYLNREGAIFILINLHTFIPNKSDNAQIKLAIYRMIKRLL